MTAARVAAVLPPPPKWGGLGWGAYARKRGHNVFAANGLISRADARPPTPGPSPQGGGEKRRYFRLLLPFLALLLALPAAAAEPTRLPLDLGSQAVSRTMSLAIEKPSRPHLPQGAADQPVERVITLGLNKTLPLDLPASVRDVVVGNPAIADVMVHSPRHVFVVAKQLGATNVFFLDAAGALVRRLELQVGPDAEAAQAAVTELLPDDDVRVRPVGDSLLLTGKVRSEAAANAARSVARRFVGADANLINQMTVLGSQQVLLRVRVAEVNRTLVKDLGLQTTVTGTGQNAFSISGGNLLAATGGLSAKLTAGSLGLQLTALEQDGLVKTLAEPNLTTLSGEAARLLAGGETPVPTSNVNGVVTVDYKPFGVGLVFTPIILSSGRINLRVESEVSAIDKTIQVNGGNGITLYGFQTRRANAVVELPSGGSLMMAGLLQHDDAVTLDNVPGIRDIPILGTLLGSTAFQHDDTELVVSVTAYIVEPIDHKALALPTDGFIPASDLRRYFLMKLQENYVGKTLDLPPSALQGPVGYIVE